MIRVLKCHWQKTQVQHNLWEVEFILDEANHTWEFPKKNFFLFWQEKEGVPALFSKEFAYELIFEKTNSHFSKMEGLLCIKLGKDEILPTNWAIKHIRPFLEANAGAGQTIRSIKEGLLAPEEITTLDLSHQQLKEIPIELLKFQKLEKLFLHDNQLQELPDFLFQLPQLKQLDLSHNHIAEVPTSISNLITLRSLFLLVNELSTLPNETGLLNQLEVLHLQHNFLTKLPNGLEQLLSLKELDIHDNQFVELPDCIHGMAQLKILKVGVPNHFGNPISHLPNWLGDLKNLMEISLTKTAITTIPPTFRQLKKLKELWLPHSVGIIDIIQLKGALPNLTIFQY